MPVWEESMKRGGVRPQPPLVQTGLTTLFPVPAPSGYLQLPLNATRRLVHQLGGRRYTALPPAELATVVMALINDPNYKKLDEWFKANGGSLKMRDMFDADKDRFSKFRLEETLWSHVKADVMVEEVGREREVGVMLTVSRHWSSPVRRHSESSFRHQHSHQIDVFHSVSPSNSAHLMNPLLQ